jgi:hypothetical protein
MKAVSVTDMSWKLYPGQRVKQGGRQNRYLAMLQGEPGSVDNYELAIIHGYGGSSSPRHRHNFEQFRWAFTQPVPFAPKLELPPGHLGYYPEGAYYGPFSIPANTEYLLLQFAGLSGSGYLGWDGLTRGYEELKQIGSFDGGVFHGTKPDGTKFNKDGYEAIWEHVHHNMKLTYPTPKYREPLTMDSSAYAWQERPGEAGVFVRDFGTFGANGPSAQMVKLTKRSTYSGPHHAGISLIVVLEGEVESDGAGYLPRSSFALDPNERVEISGAANESAELLVLNLPVFSGLAKAS